MTAPLPPPGWYPDPEDASRTRYWGGATWMQQATSTSTGNAKGSGLTISRGVVLILLALLFGAIALSALPEGPTHWSRYATEFGDAVWRMYFGTMLTLCVAALVLGVPFEVCRGWTPGKRLPGLRVHGPVEAAKPTVRQSAIRNGFTLLAIVPVIGEVLVLVAGIVIAATIHSSPTGQANTTNSRAAPRWSRFRPRCRIISPERVFLYWPFLQGLPAN